MPTLARPRTLRRRSGAGREIELRKIRCHGETKIPDPGGVAEGVTPPVGAARSISYGEFRAVARRQRDRFGDSFRGLVVPRRGNPINQEREIAVACVRGGKLKP